MKIAVDGILKEWLESKGYDFGPEVLVDDSELVKLVHEAKTAHPEYDEHYRQAWAVYSILTRNGIPKAEAESLAKAQAEVRGSLAGHAHEMKRLSAGLRELVGEITEGDKLLAEAVQAAADAIERNKNAVCQSIDALIQVTLSEGADSATLAREAQLAEDARQRSRDKAMYAIVGLLSALDLGCIIFLLRTFLA